MACTKDAAYYWLRAAAELERGDGATDATVAAVHYELAYHYGVAAAQAGNIPRKLALVDSRDT